MLEWDTLLGFTFLASHNLQELDSEIQKAIIKVVISFPLDVS